MLPFSPCTQLIGVCCSALFLFSSSSTQCTLIVLDGNDDSSSCYLPLSNIYYVVSHLSRFHCAMYSPSILVIHLQRTGRRNWCGGACRATPCSCRGLVFVFVGLWLGTRKFTTFVRLSWLCYIRPPFSRDFTRQVNFLASPSQQDLFCFFGLRMSGAGKNRINTSSELFQHPLGPFCDRQATTV